MSELKALIPYYIRPTGRVFITTGVYYLVDTSGYTGNVTFMLPPNASCVPGDHLIVKKITNDANGIAITPWNTENMNGANTPSVIDTFRTSHQYVPGCPSSYGGAAGWISW